MSFPDLPPDYDRHRDALAIVDPGACNPAGVAFALHQACRQAIAENAPQREDAPIRLICLQLAYLLNVDRLLPSDEYRQLVDTCRERSEQRERARTHEIAA